MTIRIYSSYIIPNQNIIVIQRHMSCHRLKILKNDNNKKYYFFPKNVVFYNVLKLSKRNTYFQKR